MNPKEQNAVSLLNLTGVRLMPQCGGYVVGLWKDLDCTEIRTALRVIHPQGVDVVHLDDADLPSAYKVRQCPQRRQGESFASWRQRALAQRQREAA